MDDIPTRVQRFLANQQLFSPHTLLLVAVSGGPDSLCLLHGLHQLMAVGGPRLHVAHLDHRFRGDESAADAAYVEATAAAWGLPATIAQRDVARMGYGRNRHAAARAARYAFLHEVARRIGAQAVATGHQLNDQAETVLLHMLRGAGPAGLRGMQHAKNLIQNAANLRLATSGEADFAFHRLHVPLIIRPLLTTSRAEIDAYCREHGLEPRDDPSNRAERYTRSRVRLRLLPALAHENPQIVAALGRTAQICADDYDFIQGQLDLAWPELADERWRWPGSTADDRRPTTDGQPSGHHPPPSAAPHLTLRAILLRAAAWAALHPALQRYALRRAVAALDPAYEPSFEQIEQIRDLAAGRGQPTTSGSHALAGPSANARRPSAPIGPRLLAEPLAEGLLIRRGAAPVRTDMPQLDTDRAVLMPGDPPTLRLPIGPGWACVIQSEPPAEPSPWWAQLDRAALGEGLLLRRRRAGDRFRPVGGRGSRKLQDFFVDAKLPRQLRDAWPILTTETAIVWVVGLRADARFVAGPASQDTIWVGLVRE